MVTVRGGLDGLVDKSCVLRLLIKLPIVECLLVINILLINLELINYYLLVLNNITNNLNSCSVALLRKWFVYEVVSLGCKGWC